ncbi:MAG: cupredoxin domain-containing protein [Methylocella sp.]|nr:MAG: cupredoxin domain-containing protein [Hyphomicrobiales bacterium]
MVWSAAAVMLLTCLGQVSADGQEAVTARTAIKDHRFQPDEIRVPANTPITLVIRNLDPTPEEFESKMLRVEKIVTGKAEITIRLRPLAPGRYRFYGDFNEATAEGAIIAE